MADYLENGHFHSINSTPTLLPYSLLFKAARYLHERAQYTEAEPLYLRALHICEQTLPSYHVYTTEVLHDSAVFYYAKGNIVEAMSFSEPALDARECTFGASHAKEVET